MESETVMFVYEGHKLVSGEIVDVSFRKDRWVLEVIPDCKNQIDIYNLSDCVFVKKSK